ncbi:uracil phosphoribosyltransferase [Galbibacter sp. EGI 63066]|uniref:DUF6341 family protein n=1 Tax=Galbibacter sp. EGI 63066 TaxID=2993559 RepID=UPI0022493523|nr:uracil phosphoribosyltransferase [Galbibacter sp. EGI 63066]MCX2679106.1 uracil phosphoribosyltransferase [Galbibacter sp. EGI 63066]
MSEFFYGIQSLFEDVLFVPLNALRFLDSWWLSNIINLIFITIGFVAFFYWMRQMKIFSENEKTQSA